MSSDVEMLILLEVLDRKTRVGTSQSAQRFWPSQGTSRQADGPNIRKRGLFSPPRTEVRKTQASHREGDVSGKWGN